MFQTIINKYCKLLNVLIAAALALMVVLVFGNVVMRYAFNSGLTVSEELSLAVCLGDVFGRDCGDERWRAWRWLVMCMAAWAT